MAYWRHRTKTGRVVYDRAVNKFRLSDARRITLSLDKPYLVLPQKAWTELFRVEAALLTGAGMGWFDGFLEEAVESPYLLDIPQASAIPGLSWMVLHGKNWRQAICAHILARGHVTLSRSEWIEG